MDSLLPLETKIEREYDPLWPNDYEKVVKEMRSAKRAGDQGEDGSSSPGGSDKKRRYLQQSLTKARDRFQQAAGGQVIPASHWSIFLILYSHWSILNYHSSESGLRQLLRVQQEARG